MLSERPAEWAAAVERWSELNTSIAGTVDPIDLYPLYQTLVGAWPLDLRADDHNGLETFRKRVSGWWRKALREAKLNSSWAAPDEVYEAGCDRFLTAVLDADASGAFLADVIAFAVRIAPAGALNGLTQALLRCTAPGMPDLYQGAEGWDFSQVDPDNRRPVDYGSRRAALAGTADIRTLLSNWRDGRIKQRVIAAALGLRRRWPDLFRDGGYIPLDVEPPGAGNVIAFTRRLGDRAVLVAAPLRVADHAHVDDLALSPAFLERVKVRLPGGIAGRVASNVLTGVDLELGQALSGRDLFSEVPLALFSVG